MEGGAIIPVPISVTPLEGSLELWDAVAIDVQGDCAGVGQMLAVFLRERLGIAVQATHVRTLMVPMRSVRMRPGQLSDRGASSPQRPKLMALRLLLRQAVMESSRRKTTARSEEQCGVKQLGTHTLGWLAALHVRRSSMSRAMPRPSTVDHISCCVFTSSFLSSCQAE